MEDDPAKTSSALARQLEENQKIADEAIDKTLQEFSQRQSDTENEQSFQARLQEFSDKRNKKAEHNAEMD